MKKNMLKVTSAILTILMVSMVLTNFAYADGAGWSGSIDGIANGKPTSAGYTSANSAVEEVVSAIINIIRIVAIGVAVIMLIAVAMKYLTAAPGDKAEIKKHAVVYVVGAVVLFGIYGILGIIADFAAAVA